MAKGFSTIANGMVLLAAYFVTATNAWMSPEASSLRNAITIVSISAATTVVATPTTTVSTPVTTEIIDAAAAEIVDNFTGSYADPNHPNCKRDIYVVGTRADISGTDGNPGCPPDGSGTPWSLEGKVINDDTILVDFTPKGGPKDLQGTYETDPIPGIRWPDGNFWSKKEGTSVTND